MTVASSHVISHFLKAKPFKNSWKTNCQHSFEDWPVFTNGVMISGNDFRRIYLSVCSGLSVYIYIFFKKIVGGCKSFS